jgi:hypothetical protein
MKLINLPNYVYKYISWDNEFHKRIVLNNELFFSSVKNFNDPFDSTIPLRYDKGTDDQLFDLFVQIIHRENPIFTDDKVKEMAKNELYNNDVRNALRIQNTIENQRELIATKYGIFSTSYRYNSVLMWSHYSNLHKGICIRINCKKFQDFIKNECPKNDYIIVWDKVEYKKDYPILNPFRLTDYEQIMKSLLLKSVIWKYEEEIRFILFTYSNRILTIPDGIIDQIILGCRTSKNHTQELIDFSKKKNIELIRAFRKENNFGLDFIKIDV